MAQIDAAIIGAALTPVGVFPDESSISLAAQAVDAAVTDAGIRRSDIDGIVLNLGRPSGEDYDTLVEALDLDVRFVNQFWTHGRFTGSAVMIAALAVGAGVADVVACLGGSKRDQASPSASRNVLPHGDLSAYGMNGFVHEGAMAFQRYLTIYGVERDRLADVVLASRAHAAQNELAYLRDPFSLDDYLSSPFDVAPLRVADCFPATVGGAPKNDYGVCVIVSRSSESGHVARRPVHIVGMQGVQGGREETYFGRPGLGIFAQQEADQFKPSDDDFRIYGQASIRPADVDGFYTYDAFASLVWMALERFGHCAPGAAPAFATVARIGPGGEFPVNTNGGLLSEGHTSGWGHVVEMTRQLRGEAGERQIEDASVLQWGSVFGDALVLTNEPERVAR